MKKCFAVIAVAAMLAALPACGGAPKAPSGGTETQVSGQVEPSEIVGEVETDGGEVYSQNVEITNSMGVTLVETYISVSETDDWEEEMLGGEIWGDGETMEFSTGMLGSADQTWDMMVVDEAGNEMTFYGINLSSATALDLRFGEDGTTPTVSVTEAE